MLTKTEQLISKYKDIASDLEIITGINERQDLLLTVDLVYHSVLRFEFQGRMVLKGYLEALILGDTRTGKTATVKGLMDFYKLGEMGTGESSTFAGLVGGLSQVNKRWNIQWGKIPLNDRRLFVLDEASGLSIDEISMMSGIRSTGIAEIIKIQMEKTRARTRLIWISNARRGQPMQTYTYGVLSVRELIGRPEDISRFDIVITSASGDVESDVYNKAVKRQQKIKIKQRLYRDLILWAWSRTPSDVIIGAKATQAILDYASTQGKKYNSGIPIVEPAEQRIKLAKMAVAVACRFFSCSEDGERVMVYPEHAEFAYHFLEKCYSKSSMRYDEWAKKQNEMLVLRDVEEVKKIIPRKTVDMFMDSEVLNLGDVEDMVGDRLNAKDILKVLRHQRALIKVNSSLYKKTPAFITFLRDVMSGKITLPVSDFGDEEVF